MPVVSWELKRSRSTPKPTKIRCTRRLADQAFCVGPAPSSGSYLNIPNIISTAVLAEVDAIHPGYGYLSEQAHFAEICHTHGIKFIGPPVAAIEKMGDKAAARRIMKKAGLPVIPGSEPVQSEEEALAAAEEIGYPIMLKAASGGGGKGMRVVETPRRFGVSSLQLRPKRRRLSGIVASIWRSSFVHRVT